ncbi:MAG: hypothetical protein PHP92_05665 [Candidatus Nanoarchaeia archaeon]|nr:hypothetical protein [Candidatus Nanoarchaeia archaeon]
MNKASIKNLVYFISALVISIGLGLALSILIDIILWPKEFWICASAAAAIFYTGYRTANLSKPFTIYEYLEKQNPLELEKIAIEAVGMKIIKRKRESDKEATMQDEIASNILKIVERIDKGAKEGRVK